jgi:hypothetical protein
MEQSDLNLLQNVPSYHLQAVIKSRRGPITFLTDRLSEARTQSVAGRNGSRISRPRSPARRGAAWNRVT